MTILPGMSRMEGGIAFEWQDGRTGTPLPAARRRKNRLRVSKCMVEPEERDYFIPIFALSCARESSALTCEPPARALLISSSMEPVESPISP